MRLTFLGTGPDKAIPRPGHRDAACQDARRGGQSRRSRSAALIRISGRNILIDAGPDITAQLGREGIGIVDAVFLTHAHADAAGGLTLLDRYLRKRSDHKRVPVFTDKLTTGRLAKKFPNLGCLWFCPIENFLPVTFDDISFHPFPVAHSIQPSFPTRGYLLKRDGKRLLAYASDVASLPWTTRRFLRGTPLLILDGAMYLKTKMATHLSVGQAIATAAALKTEKLILTQIGHSYPPHDLAEKEIKKYLRGKKLTFPGSVRLAYDGLEIGA